MDILEVACDESGAEGENLVGAASRVFTHGSTILTLDEAHHITADVAAQLRSTAAEIKSGSLLPARRQALVADLFSADGLLAGRCKAMIIDKEFFLVANVIDLLVEELAHAEGLDLYTDNTARTWARVLHRDGRRALGPDLWNRLLAEFNSLTRLKQRKGEKATLDGFFTLIDTCRARSHRRSVSGLLDQVARARPHAESFQARFTDPDLTPALNPIVTSVYTAAWYWYRAERKPIEIVHDRQDALTPQLISSVMTSANSPLPEFARLHGGRTQLNDIRQVDSRDDPRVQIADWVAGIIRVEALAALTRERPPAPWVPLYVLAESPWSDEKSWTTLTGHRLVR